jgi:hypothetical protein
MRKLELCRHHAHHGVTLTIERDALIDDVGFAREASLPETITQDNNALIFSGKHSAGCSLCLEHRKEIRGNVSAANALRFAGARNIETVIRVGCYCVEDLCLTSVIFVLGSLGWQALDVEGTVISPNHLQAI